MVWAGCKVEVNKENVVNVLGIFIIFFITFSSDGKSYLSYPDAKLRLRHSNLLGLQSDIREDSGGILSLFGCYWRPVYLFPHFFIILTAQQKNLYNRKTGKNFIILINWHCYINCISLLQQRKLAERLI